MSSGDRRGPTKDGVLHNLGAHYSWWQTRTGWRFHFRAANGKVIASGQGYSRRIDMMKAIKLLQGSAGAKVVSRDGVAL